MMEGVDVCYHCEDADPKPDVYCPICECVYHDGCFDEDSFHDGDEDPHPRSSIRRRDEQIYINQPNLRNTITESDILRDNKNRFIEIDHRTLKLKFGEHAFNLLRPSALDVPCDPSSSDDTLQTPGPMPTPGFISFLGQTGTGKSWIIRSLMKDFPGLPSPLPSPGKTANLVVSTSSNINVYVDGTTAYTNDPILFMDVEGLDGSGVPLTLKEVTHDPPPARRTIAQKIYPKLAYLFSNCIVFVSTDSMQAGKRIIDAVRLFATTASRGSRHQGFRPALFIVFNKVVDHTSDWSIEASTNAFKRAFQTQIQHELEAYFDPIHVIKIPHSSQSSPMKALDQLEALDVLLRQEHKNASIRRLQFSLAFSLDELMQQLGRALRVFSGGDDNPSFDWTKEMMRRSPTPSTWRDSVKAFWRQCLQRRQGDSPVASFRSALHDFSAHFAFCVHLHLRRFPIIDHKLGSLSEDMVESVCEIQRHIEQFTPCNAVREDGTACGGTQQRHNVNRHESPSVRWVGRFEPAVQVNLVREIEDAHLVKTDRSQLTVFDAPNPSFMFGVRCISSCLGCLVIPPSVFLECGHTLCETCVQEIAGQDHHVHDLTTIECPFCSREMTFSPRLLPPNAGYRILSLDGGGVRGIAQIHMLAAIERQCFGIPIVHLFDSIIGTSIGGHLALSLASKESPSAVRELKEEFFDVMNEGIKRRVPLESDVVDAALLVVFDLTSHKNDPIEKSLKGFFGSDRRVLAASNPPGPLVAVTTVSMDDLGTALVIPNYVTALNSGDGIPRLIGPNSEDCISIWEAARATAAAFPYFAPSMWREKKLLDGGFRANCPAELGYKEARSVWPHRPLDLLVSLGTGSYNKRSAQPPKHLALKVGRLVVEAITNSTQLWEAFQARVGEDGSRCFRLDPLLSKDFGLADVKSLESISGDAEDWLKNQGHELANISNHLIASLFFCTACATKDVSTWTFHIFCRLPNAVEGKAKLVDRLVKVARKRNLFTAKSSNCATFHCDAESVLLGWRRAGLHGPIVIPLSVTGLPMGGEVKVHINMADIFRDDPTRFYRISGMPYPVRGPVE